MWQKRIYFGRGFQKSKVSKEKIATYIVLVRRQNNFRASNGICHI
jgi:hypothetical protein